MPLQIRSLKCRAGTGHKRRRTRNAPPHYAPLGRVGSRLRLAGGRTGILSLSIEKKAGRAEPRAADELVGPRHPSQTGPRHCQAGIPVARGQWIGCDHNAIPDNALHQDRFTF